jgi:hypothetical protein
MQAPGEEGGGSGGGDKMDASDVSSDGDDDDDGKGDADDKEGGDGDEEGSDDEEGPGAGMKLAACSVDFNVGFFSDQASGFEVEPLQSFPSSAGT